MYGPNIQTEESFIEGVKSAIDSSTASDDEKTRLKNGSTPGGTFDNTSGTLNFVDATGTEFSGEVSNGTVRLKDTTSATLTDLKVTDVTAEYEYASNDNYSAPSVNSNYIEVVYTPGKTETDAQAECEGKFATGSTISTFNGNSYGTATDDRLTFPEILADENLNLAENKLATNHIPTAVKGYDASAGLSVDDTVNIQFEGSDALKFATGKTVDSDKVIGFAGDQRAFTGAASFAGEITKVVANGDNTLPVNLVSDMGNINVEINGENKIDNSGSTTIKNLKVNSGATLTVAAGTTLNIGSEE